jgi:hypothetical protein
MSDIGTWSAWTGPPARPPANTAVARKRRRPVAVPRETQLEIRGLEERLANPGPGDTPRSLAPIFADDFREFGSSGRIFDAATVLGASSGAEQLPGRGVIALEGFRVERVAPHVVLATYTGRTAGGSRPAALRSSLWRKTDDHWQIVFHQGTPVPAKASP